MVIRNGRPSRSPVRELDEAAKRLLDVVLALIQGLLALPVCLLVPLAIKLDDGGDVFYGQERVGRGGRLFTSWKFRTMAPRKEGGGALLQADLEEHRITRVGRILRATALDELPQLWNILKGDMSYVGPRALLPEETVDPDAVVPLRLCEVAGYDERHSVRPGLTGLAQTRLARDATHREKFRYDLLYVRSRSLGLDLALIVQSFWISFRGAWPEVGRKEAEDPQPARRGTDGPERAGTLSSSRSR